MIWGQAVKVSALCHSVNLLIASFRDTALSIGFSARSASLFWLFVTLGHICNTEEH